MRPARTRRLLALVAILVTWAVLVPSPALATEDLAAYAGRVEQAIAAVEEATPRLTDAAGGEELAAQLRVLLPEGELVEASGVEVATRDDTLRRAIGELEDATGTDARRRAAAEIRTHLESMLQAIGTPTAEKTEQDPEVLAKIMEQERIGQSETPSWLLELERMLEEWLAKLFPDASKPVRVVFDWVLPVLAVIALLIVAVLVVKLWRRGVARRDGVEVADGDAAAPVVAVAEGLPDDVLAYADAAAGEGRFRDAVRALFGGAARSLGEKGVLPRTRTRTTAELLRDVAAARDLLSPPLRDLATVFEPSWYGHRDPGNAGFVSARSAYVSFTSLLEAGDAA